VVVVDPRKVRVIAETKHKTDRTDARILADLLRTGALPKALWRVPKATRQLRDKVRLRWGLVQQRAGLYLRARSLLSSIGINLGKRALVNEATWNRILKRKDVPADMKTLLEILKTCIHEMSHAIAAVEKQYEPDLERSEVRRLQAIPAVGPIVAVTTVAGLGDPARLKDSRTAAA